jgi:hypothetical protein
VKCGLWVVVGCWLLVVGCWLSVVGCRLSVVGCRLSVIGCWLSVVGCRLLVGLLVVGCWLSLVVVGCCLLVVDDIFFLSYFYLSLAASIQFERPDLKYLKIKESIIPLNPPLQFFEGIFYLFFELLFLFINFSSVTK